MKRISFETACQKTRGRVDAHVDRELVGAARQEVRLHLEACSACAAESKEHAALKSRVRDAVRAQEPSLELADKVRSRLQTEQSRPWWTLPWTAPKWTMAVATLVVASAVAWIVAPRDSFPALDDRPAQDAYIQRISASLAGVLRPGLADHVHCAIFRTGPADAPSAAAMIAGLGAYRDLIPAVNSAKQWRAVTAHQCSYLDRKYVHVIMSDGDRPISLVIARKEEGESFAGMKPIVTVGGVPLYQSETAGYRVAGFETGRHLAFLVSGLGNAENVGILSKLVPDVSVVLAGNL